MDRYEKALKAIKKLFEKGEKERLTITAYRGEFEEIFPELKESEDEKIRKAIVKFFEIQDDNIAYSFVSKKDIIAWLEKQKPAESVNGEDYGIDGLWHAQRILEKTLGEVEGYQSDDGILEHKAAIGAVKSLYEQKPIEWNTKEKELWSFIVAGLDSYYRLRKNDGKAIPAELEEAIGFIHSLHPQDLKEKLAEWSEEDEKILKDILLDVRYNGYNNDMQANSLKKIGWLNSIKDRCINYDRKRQRIVRASLRDYV